MGTRSDQVDALLHAVGTAADDRLNALNALPTSAWLEHLQHLGRDASLRAAIKVVRCLALPIWAARRPGDPRPMRALEAAEMCLRRVGDDDARRYAQVAAKGCSAARKISLGSEHRIADAAHAVAVAAGRTQASKSVEASLEAIDAVQAHLLYEYAIEAAYGRQTDVKRAVLSVMSQTLGSPRANQTG